MLELPEVLTLVRQLNESVKNRRIRKVWPPTKAHKFCWYNGEPEEYDKALSGSRIAGAEGFGTFAELIFDNGRKLCVNDGVNLRLMPAGKVPGNYQLMMELDDGQALVFTVTMYGGIFEHDGSYDNHYYLASRNSTSPFAQDFPAYYLRIFSESKPTLSAKAFLATEQRFPGIGNGTLQDILFEAGIHPKRKIGTLEQKERDKLLQTVMKVLNDMTKLGGRDTEKDLFGASGGYKTRMSKNTAGTDCGQCGGTILKENYLGGSVYFCPECQHQDLAGQHPVM